MERTGEWKNSEHVYVQGNLYLYKLKARIDLQEGIYDENVTIRKFNDNAERDELLNEILGWITEEQFRGTGKLEIGKECLVSDDGEEWHNHIYAGKVAKQLGMDKRYLARSNSEKDGFLCWEYAKPINDCLKIDGEIYTWEGAE